MDFLSQTLEVYLFFNTLTFVNGYVLLAANLDDFQTLAKKLGSEKFIEQLLQLTNDPEFERYSPKSVRINHNRAESNSNFNQVNRNIPIARYREPKSSLILKQSDAKIDFEELVERVRQRLEKEFQNKYKTDKTNKQRINSDVNKANSGNRQRIRLQKTTNEPSGKNVDSAERENENASHETIEVKVESEKNIEPMYVDYKYHKQKDNDEDNADDKRLPFKKIEMVKDDSYEDYVTPEKETNIYSSKERDRKVNRFKIENNVKSSVTSRNKEFRYKVTLKTTDEYADAIGSSEIKARTERLFYDENYHKGKVVFNKISGTGVPTRETYKIVTPNYYASLPTVAERYDFNEPLPERDREPENLKYIGNPPARINKKVKLL